MAIVLVFFFQGRRKGVVLAVEEEVHRLERLKATTMFATVKNRVWAFDAEWIPDPVVASRQRLAMSRAIFKKMTEKVTA